MLGPLHGLIAEIASRKIKVVNLTNTQHDGTLVLALPSEWNLQVIQPGRNFQIR
jgi:hypothetical protein